MRAPSWARRVFVLLVVCGAALATFVDEKPLESSGLEFGSVASASHNALVVEGTLEVLGAFRVARADVGVAFRGEPASGTPTDPVRLSTPAARATTSLAQDDWTLAFELVQETNATGVFEADLTFDGEPTGVISIEAAARGTFARLIFDIGPTFTSSSAYVLRVRPAEDSVQGIAYEIASEPTGRLVWVGRGDLASEDSPKLAARAGAPLRVTWKNEDGIPHDLVILAADASVAAGPTPIIDTAGERATLAWTAPAPGDYTYACRIHRTTMWGAIEVR